MNRAASLFLALGLLTTACDGDDDDPGMRDCASDSTVCDPFTYAGALAPCPEGDMLCTDEVYLDGTPVQCLSEHCRATIDDISSPACPDDSRVRACVTDEACPDPMAWCGHLWPGCEMVCGLDQIAGSELCSDLGCDPTTCDEEDSYCTQSPAGAMACYAAECADGGPQCSDLDATYFECDAMIDDRCIPFLTCGRIQYCLFED